MAVISETAWPGRLNETQVAKVVSQALPPANYRGKRVLLIVPDHTRTAPVGLLFKSIFAQLGERLDAERQFLADHGSNPGREMHLFYAAGRVMVDLSAEICPWRIFRL